jgi:hypothetical protein
MKYASTKMIDGTETAVVVLPLGRVPLWDPNDPRPGTHLVPDGVEAGWVMDGGVFAPPQETEPLAEGPAAGSLPAEGGE